MNTGIGGIPIEGSVIPGIEIDRSGKLHFEVDMVQVIKSWVKRIRTDLSVWWYINFHKGDPRIAPQATKCCDNTIEVRYINVSPRDPHDIIMNGIGRFNPTVPTC